MVRRKRFSAADRVFAEKLTAKADEDGYDAMRRRLQEAERQRDKALAVLRDLRWAGNEDHTECISCRALGWNGCYPDCRLAALLREDAAPPVPEAVVERMARAIHAITEPDDLTPEVAAALWENCRLARFSQARAALAALEEDA